MRVQIILAVTVSLLASCTPQQSIKRAAEAVTDKYFSMREQNPTTTIYMVQLETPALLSTAKTVNGRAEINQEQKQLIIDEQEAFIINLKNLANDAKIIYTYKMVLNAVAFTASSELESEILKLEGVGKLVESASFERPTTFSSVETLTKAVTNYQEKNTVHFIGADKAHKAGITGKNITVGIIDTGIDYIHEMFGGPGTKEIYDVIQPDAENAYFPNSKVVGGVDFVGSKYNAREESLEHKVPVRDNNPLDESGHGTHVAGSVAGLTKSTLAYDGVAPDADLYALKVFGKTGSVSDFVVVAALEYSADPKEEINPANRLDVVNLSLGGGFGKPNNLYNEAIKNLVKAGTIVVASAGNSGDTPYITGAPGTSDEAISVAASIDDLAHNISIPAVLIELSGGANIFERSEGTKTLPAEGSNISGNIIYLGKGGKEAPEALKKDVQGKIAFMDRGEFSFEEKFKYAKDLGAIGVVLANNVDGANSAMTSEKEYDFPAVMITKRVGQLIKDDLAKNLTVFFDFSPGESIQRNDLIDTMTGFSSRGPRSMDSLIKPEISGPGQNIISAGFGTGNVYVQMSGTSMSGPHLAGVMALLRQKFPTASVPELKARVLNTAKIMKEGDKYIAVARQGAGRVQVNEALTSKVVAMPATLSLGEVPVAGRKSVAKKITLTNTSDKDLTFSTRALHSKNISVSVQNSFKVKANSSLVITASFTLERENAAANNVEADGFIIIRNSDSGEEISLPFLAVLNKVSDISAGEIVTQTNSQADKYGSEVKLTLVNNSLSSGDALVFNLLGTDARKEVKAPLNLSASTLCDLESAGVRIIDRNEEGQNKKILQFAVKLYGTMTSWQPCDVSVQFDTDGDGVADQELVGIQANYISGVASSAFSSILLDAQRARYIRADYEYDASVGENYLPAILGARPMKFYNHSNVAVIEADLSLIKPKNKKSDVGIKLALMHLEANTTPDDFLADHEKNWQKVSLVEDAFSYYDMPEVITIAPLDREYVSLRRGKGNMRALILYPHNSPTGLEDKQSQILLEKLLK